MTTSKILSLSFVLAALAACSSSPSASHPRAQDAAREFLTAYCQKLSTCSPQTFSAAYPNGVSDCVNGPVSKIGSGDLESCSQAQVDQCTTDAGNMACPSDISAASLPASCNGC